jgi:hypothetical protein
MRRRLFGACVDTGLICEVSDTDNGPSKQGLNEVLFWSDLSPEYLGYFCDCDHQGHRVSR